jgi:hypothetical protein
LLKELIKEISQQEISNTLATAFDLPENTSVTPLGSFGGLAVTTPSTAAKEHALKFGIKLSNTNLIFRCEEFKKKAQKLPHCTKCAETGHRASKCQNNPRCRICGSREHHSIDGKCPEGKLHPKHTNKESKFCVRCEKEGHTSGSGNCSIHKQETQATKARTYAEVVNSRPTPSVAPVGHEDVTPWVIKKLNTLLVALENQNTSNPNIASGIKEQIQQTINELQDGSLHAIDTQL